MGRKFGRTLSLRVARIALAALAMLVTAAPSAAQRSLSWPSIDVTAHLDADGRLHVRERQQIRLTGDWNGAERRFNVRFGQRFTFEGILRIDSASGQSVALVEDEIDAVGGFAWYEGHLLRWRSRLPEDPPFDNALRTYELTFNYADILDVNGGDRYSLAHDFAFADREGDIDRFTLRLTIDSAWRAPSDFEGIYEVSALSPGNSFVLTVPLVRVAAAPPGAVRQGAGRTTRLALLGVLATALVVVFGRVMVHDRRRGRFAPVFPPESVTPEWLKSEVFAHLPEVVGAAWDDTTAQPEVAATLARLVQEKKLSSRVDTQKVLMFRRHVLHLELNVGRGTLRPHERALIDALFSSHERTTDTDRVRKRYASSGFDPANTIRSGLAPLVEAMGPTESSDKRAKWITLGLLLTGVALIIAGVTQSGIDFAVAAVVLVASLPMFVIARAAAAVWKRRVADYGLAGLIMIGVPVTAVVLIGRHLLLENTYRTGALVLAGLVVWLLALFNSLGNGARIVQSTERIAARKRLVAARNYFRAELSRSEPRLRDAWYPYMLAFGLGPHVDRWFKAFGAAAAGTSSALHTRRAMGSAASGSSESSGFTGFGGGGGFSGGGGGASFGAAIGSMAASVPAPSSSSSSGGSSSSSSGGSSGGGGGGGW